MKKTADPPVSGFLGLCAFFFCQHVGEHVAVEAMELALGLLKVSIGDLPGFPKGA